MLRGQAWLASVQNVTKPLWSPLRKFLNLG